MKPIQHIAIVLFMVLSLSACKEDPPIPLFEMNFTERVVLPGGQDPFSTLFIESKQLRTNFETFLENAGFVGDDVKVISPSTCVFEAVFDEIDFDFLESVSVYIYETANRDNSVEVFFMEPVPSNQRGDLQLFGTLANAEFIMSNENFDIEFRIKWRYITVEPIDVDINYGFTAFKE